jgi:hypothetical protein
MDRRTVALGIAAALAVAAALTVTLTGRSSASPRHKAVATYIQAVDQAQLQMHTQLTKTVKAYADFQRGKVPAKTLAPELATSEVTLRRLGRTLAAIPAPPEAKRLRVLLGRLTLAEVAIAHEVTQLAVFAGPYAALLHQAKAAGAVLSHALGAVKTPAPHKIRGTKAQVKKAQAAFLKTANAAAARQAVALDAYDAKITIIEHRLRRLRPPAVMRPANNGQIRTLEASRVAGAALSAELRKANRSRVPVLGRRFTLAARIAGSVSTQRAQIAAIKAYNRRVRGIGTLQGEIRQELAHVQNLTG